MQDLKIDLMRPRQELPPSPKAKKIIFLAALLFFVAGAALSPLMIAQNVAGLNPSEIWQNLKNLGMNQDRLLKGELDNRVNILLLGMGGEGHDGAFLTDTIILASLRPSDNKIALLSIPRDLVVFIPGYGWRKINNVNAFAEVEKPGSGGQATADIISKTFSIPIHYYARLDFEGFKKAIDDLNGVRVYVENPFTDANYPTDDYKYQTISFEKGWQTMDGDQALKFTRSRHGTNNENSDFARSRRQQKILFALKEKIFSFETLTRPSRVRKATEDIQQHFSTNIELWETLRLAQILRRSDPDQIAIKVLEEEPNGPLEAQMFDGAFLLFPKNNDWQTLRNIAANLLGDNGSSSSGQKSVPPDAIVEIQNGTLTPGLAAKAADQLAQLGFTVAKIGNAPIRDFDKTIIYDLSNGNKEQALQRLQNELNANVALSLPTWLQSKVEPQDFLLAPRAEASAKNQEVDFLIILGAENTK